MDINAVYVKKTKEILYSRSRNDFRWCEYNRVGVNGGLEYFKVVGDPDEYIEIHLDGDVLLKHILIYDDVFGNKNVPSKYKDGYHGRYQLNEYSSLDFFSELVINWEDIVQHVKED